MTATRDQSKVNTENEGFALDGHNYRLMIIGVVVVVIGYLLMVGGGSDDPNVFNEEIFSFRRITLAPIVVMAGYGLIFYSILSRKRGTEKPEI